MSKISEATNYERLTPLDLLMPQVYISTLLAFPTAQPSSSVIHQLQEGLKNVSKQLPWLSGQVFPAKTAIGNKPTLHIQWNTDSPSPSLIDKGSISAAYETLAAEGMYSGAIPDEVWPLPVEAGILSTQGTPVFAASIFNFADNKGIGLCIYMHHNATDATGLGEIIHMWSRSIADDIPSTASLDPNLDRLDRLTDVLSPRLAATSKLPLSTLYARHSEYSQVPPAFPAEFSASSSKLFTIPIAKIHAMKEELAKHGSAATINTVLCSLIWQAITRTRVLRNPSLEKEGSSLVTAVNGRRRIGLSKSEDIYFGNTVLYALSQLSVSELIQASAQDQAHVLAKTCSIIAESQSPHRIGAQHIAEVCSLVSKSDNYQTVFPGWDLFNSRDLTITSWADLKFYEMDFGASLGRPEFVRPKYTEADGVAMIMPKREIRAEIEGLNELEVIDVVVMLRRDDMEAFDFDGILDF